MAQDPYESVYIAMAREGYFDRALVGWAIAEYRVAHPTNNAPLKEIVAACRSSCDKYAGAIASESAKPSKIVFEATLDDLETVYATLEREFPLALRNFRKDRREMEKRLAADRLVARLDMCISQAYELGRSIVRLIERMEQFESCVTRKEEDE